MFEKVKSIRIALCLVIISFLMLCGFVTTRDEKYVSYFLHLYSAGLFREHNFTLHDATATFGKDHIHRIEMQLSCYKALPLESARKLITSVGVDFLEKINSDPGLKEKGLIKEKFIPRQLYIRILCDNVIGESYESIFIREIVLDKGQVTYITFQNMPEIWGKSYTIHEEFDYALMLTGNAREPEDVMHEERIMPQMRALPGDTNDYPHRQHEELLYTSRPLTRKELEQQEAAPSPIVPLQIAVEDFSQLNILPAVEEDEDEEEQAPADTLQGQQNPAVVPPEPTQNAAPTTVSTPDQQAPIPSQIQATSPQTAVPQTAVPQAAVPQATGQQAAVPQATVQQATSPNEHLQTTPEQAIPQPTIVVPAPSSPQIPAPQSNVLVPTVPVPNLPAPVIVPQPQSGNAPPELEPPTKNKSEGSNNPVDVPGQQVLPPADQVTVPELKATPTLPQLSEESSQSQERLKQAEDEGLKLLSKKDAESSDDYTDKRKVPSLPEFHVADAEPSQEVIQDKQDNKKEDNQIDFFGLFDSFTSSDSAKNEVKQHDTPIAFNEQNEPDSPQELQDGVQKQAEPTEKFFSDALPDDSSTPPDENFEMPEDEFSSPLAPEAPEAPQLQQVPQVVASVEESINLIADAAPVEALESETPDSSSTNVDEDNQEKSVKADSEPSIEDIEPPQDAPIELQEPKSWWEKLFSSKDTQSETEDAQKPHTDSNDSQEEGLNNNQNSNPEQIEKSESISLVQSDVAEQNETIQPQETKSWWESLFGPKETATPDASNDVVTPNELPEQENSQVEIPQEIALVEADAAEQNETIQPQETKSWWESLFGPKETATPDASNDVLTPNDELAEQENSQVEIPQEIALVETDVEQQNETTEPQQKKSWWKSLFGPKETPTPDASNDVLTTNDELAEQENSQVEIPQEISLVETDVEQQNETTEPQETKSWWQSLFESKETPTPDASNDVETPNDELAEQENSQVEIPQEISLVETEVEQQNETTEPQETKSWWQSLFAPKETSTPDASNDVETPNELSRQENSQVEIPQEISLVETDVEQQNETTEHQETKSWWQSLFAPKETPAPDAANAVETPNELPEQENSQVEIPQEITLVETDAAEQNEITPPQQTTSWWQSLFEPKEKAVSDASNDVETQNELPEQETEKGELPQEIVLVETEVEHQNETNEPQETKSWWQSLFGPKEPSTTVVPETPDTPDEETVEPKFDVPSGIEKFDGANDQKLEQQIEEQPEVLKTPKSNSVPQESATQPVLPKTSDVPNVSTAPKAPISEQVPQKMILNDFEQNQIEVSKAEPKLIEKNQIEQPSQPQQIEKQADPINHELEVPSTPSFEPKVPSRAQLLQSSSNNDNALNAVREDYQEKPAETEKAYPPISKEPVMPQTPEALPMQTDDLIEEVILETDVPATSNLEPTEAPKSWWQGMFSGKEKSTEEKPSFPEQDVTDQTETPQEIVLVEDDVELTADTQSTETPKSWWQRMFPGSSKSAEETPIQPEQQVSNETEIPQEISLAEEDVELAADTQPTQAPKSWWQSMFSAQDKSTENVDATSSQIEQDISKETEIPQAISLVEDEQTADPETPKETKSWWQAMFSGKDKTVEETPEPSEKDTDQNEIPQEVAFIEDSVTPNQESTETPKSWWQTIFSGKNKEVETTSEQSQENTNQIEIQQEISFGEDDESLSTNSTNTDSTEAPKSWWEKLFESKNSTESSKVSDIQIQEQDDIEETIDTDENQVEQVVPDAETSESWWNRVFSSKDAPRSQVVDSYEDEDIVFNDESEDIADTQIEPMHEQNTSEVAEIKISENKLSEMSAKPTSDGLFFVPTLPASNSEVDAHEEVFVESTDDSDELAVLPHHSRSETDYTLPHITIEHVQVDTDEAIGREEENATDPVLKSLYREPLSWMQARSASNAIGSWGENSESDTSVIADATQTTEPDMVETDEELIYTDTDDSAQEEQ